MAESETKALAAFLRARRGHLYLLIDAACDHACVPQLRAKGLDVYSLFSGTKEITLAEVAPYLVRLPTQQPILESLIEQHWGYGKCWSSIVEGIGDMEQIRLQLKKSLTVELDNGLPAYFRFYDARAFGKFIAISSMAQMDVFFGESIHEVHYASSHQSASLMSLRKIPKGGLVKLMQKNSYKLFSLVIKSDAYVENIEHATR